MRDSLVDLIGQIAKTKRILANRMYGFRRLSIFSRTWTKMFAYETV